MRSLLFAAIGVCTTINLAEAQAVISLQPAADTASGGTVTSNPSVDAGRTNGTVKAAGSPSVGDGHANGVVKSRGAPSVGDGIANGVVKATTVHQ